MRRQGGFSYVIVLFAVAILAVLSARALENSMMKERREKEAELMFVGQAYRNAVRSYYEQSPGTTKSYPGNLDDLIADNRTTTLRRHLRKRYRDPVTGSTEWGIVKNEDGKIMGVYSLSQQAPVKTGAFPSELTEFANARRYQDWLFVYKPE
jgi:type II secretory pathway pseudopilin PulG